MSSASDTNIVGDDITPPGCPRSTARSASPTPTWCPSLARPRFSTSESNTTASTYFSTTGLPVQSGSVHPSGCRHHNHHDRRHLRGNSRLRCSEHRPRDQHDALANLFGTYNVGSSGVLSPLPGTVSGYYVARVRVIDQSGNQSNPSDPNAQLPFVVDNTAPTATFTSPTADQVITSLNNGVLTFTITTSKNIDLTHFNASSINLISAGPDGVLGTTDDVTIPINAASISVTYLDKGIGGPGAEQITFSSQAGTALTNNLYEITLLNTGAGAVRDIAGNVLANPVSQIFAVNVPSLAKNLFVEEGASATSATGTRENPYPTISAGHEGRCRRRRDRRAFGCVPGTGHAQAGRQAVLGGRQQHR